MEKKYFVSYRIDGQPGWALVNAFELSEMYGYSDFNETVITNLFACTPDEIVPLKITATDVTVAGRCTAQVIVAGTGEVIDVLEWEDH